MLSGEEGWTPTADALARQLALDGAMVAGIDWAKFKANLEADADQCVFPDGDLENLSHFVQAYFRNSTYLSPVLVGTSSGAAMAYAMLAQAPRNTFAAAVTLGFCPSFNLQKPLCRGSGLEFTRSTRGRGVDLLPIKNLANPWLALQGSNDRQCPVSEAQHFVSQIHGAASVTLPQVDIRMDIHGGISQACGAESDARGAPAGGTERFAHHRSSRAARLTGLARHGQIPLPSSCPAMAAGRDWTRTLPPH
jgi:type IV secretory pathway VirJ component